MSREDVPGRKRRGQWYRGSVLWGPRVSGVSQPLSHHLWESVRLGPTASQQLGVAPLPFLLKPCGGSWAHWGHSRMVGVPGRQSDSQTFPLSREGEGVS